MVHHKHIVIIGAGIAGLSAASYLQRNNYQVTLLEKHRLTGGLCTSWERNGYTIDYCVHWLMGSKPGTEYHRIWQELEAFTNIDGSTVPIVNFDDFTTIGLPNNESLHLFSDIDQLQDEMLRLGKEDAKEILIFCNTLRSLAYLDIPSITDEMNFGRWLLFLVRNFTRLRHMIRHMMPLNEYAKRFSNPKIKELFKAGIPGDWSLASLSLGLAKQHTKSAGYPVGGSLNLAKNIERTFLALGGTVRYAAKVTKVLVEDNCAKGVLLGNGEEIAADYVISAADGYTTLYSMLEGKYLPKPVLQAYEEYPLFPSSVFVALGVEGDRTDLPHATLPLLETPLVLPDGSEHPRFSVTVYNFDPTLAPKGSTLITVLMNTWNGTYWSELAKTNRKAYEDSKKAIADKVIDHLEKIFGNIRDSIEMLDVSTPHTVIRYTGNWKGSYEGFAPTKKTLSSTFPKKLKGLRNFAMIGQWTQPGGGLPTAAKDGRDIAIRICKEDKMPFKAQIPTESN
jgi:phytoene dehydrogenase-like protein